MRKLSQSREGQRSGEEKSDGSQNGEARNKWNYLTRNSKKKVLSKDGKHSDVSNILIVWFLLKAQQTLL